MDQPSTPEQHAAIALAAKHRVGYLQWLAAHLQEPKYSGMLPVGRADIRNAAAHELLVLAEGCK